MRVCYPSTSFCYAVKTFCISASMSLRYEFFEYFTAELYLPSKKEASTKGLGSSPNLLLLLLLKVYPVKLCDVKAKNVFTTKLYSVAAYPRTYARSLFFLTLCTLFVLFLTRLLRLYMYFFQLYFLSPIIVSLSHHRFLPFSLPSPCFHFHFVFSSFLSLSFFMCFRTSLRVYPS